MMRQTTASTAWLLLVASSLISSCRSSVFNHNGPRTLDHVGDNRRHGAISALPTSEASRRHLAIGDFARFNELFAGAELMLVDSIQVGDTVKVTINNLFCRNINVGDMQTNFTIFNQNGLDVLAYTINVNPFSMTCEADFQYEMEVVSFLPSIKGSGTFVAALENNSVLARIDMSGASTFLQDPPTTAVVSSCVATINTNADVELGGTFQAFDDLDVVQDLISNVVDDQAKSGRLILCANSSFDTSDL
jgi:hypothetical protein